MRRALIGFMQHDIIAMPGIPWSAAGIDATWYDLICKSAIEHTELEAMLLMHAHLICEQSPPSLRGTFGYQTRDFLTCTQQLGFWCAMEVQVSAGWVMFSNEACCLQHTYITDLCRMTAQVVHCVYLLHAEQVKDDSSQRKRTTDWPTLLISG